MTRLATLSLARQFREVLPGDQNRGPPILSELRGHLRHGPLFYSYNPGGPLPL